MITDLVNYLKTKPYEVKWMTWKDKWDEQSFFIQGKDISMLEVWSTYERHVDFYYNLNVKENTLECKIEKHNTGFSSGTRRLDFTVFISFPIEYIHTLTDKLVSDFDNFLDDAYETHLENKKRLWILETKRKVLL
ncbi:MAG: hypothetical protein NTZ48_05600 [Candidatus Omnitrophica bacterium]|nr:hypothetical protein [Candidatus Omnitrophota bacterium]